MGKIIKPKKTRKSQLVFIAGARAPLSNLQTIIVPVPERYVN